MRTRPQPIKTKIIFLIQLKKSVHVKTKVSDKYGHKRQQH
jgi:hypothetical protein